ncbi:SDR family NAD(P)-dependent oxidoreductase [Dyadobacter alkalitolerans]|uniref:SDR family NAD(P)-dependent oxidoreductase n=1 Tax=Dyadobacter alkalitolerans TaxID=492736 RepID=UPI00041BE44F|nr:SDR family NAD(P)-dependent oxidoreductase [Dyadobacter alkalitolerans]
MTSKKTAFITGANKGVGLATAKQLAKLDYQVYLGSRDKINGQKAVEELRKLGLTNVDLIKIDVTDEESIIKAKLELESKIERLDVLVNNAGIGGTYPQHASGISMDNFFKKDFYKIYRITPQRWLTQRRLELAHYFLAKKNRRPIEVYLQTGFENLSHFSYAFKKQFGITPTEFAGGERETIH